jgi:uncharacterized integral membrane protein
MANDKEDVDNHVQNGMPLLLKTAIAVYTAVLLVVLLYLLVKLWPVAKTPLEPASFFWGTYVLPLEVRYIIIAAIAGALGSYVHLATSFVDYAGNGKLTLNWGWWYLLRPFIGVALAELVYLALRAGVVTAGAPESVSLHGVASMCALSGLFSKQATDKLREIFDNVFRTEQPVQREGALQPKGKSTAAGG